MDDSERDFNPKNRGGDGENILRGLLGRRGWD